ncbi:MAG: hypothetical protein CMM75_11605 [Rhodospirillaceae bacterium]|nr:hypothetical protein [Rhodospirillaceae bacterium]|tara:strand:+ start:612 stop:1112 length:501 start_codon:yes stop_codon:yes gene_type:complete
MNLALISKFARFLTIMLMLIMIAREAIAQTGLPLPRFVSLKANEVHMRTGPGSRYPILWKLIYRHMPVEIIAEFKNWRKIREWEGDIGWVHKSMLKGQRWAIVQEGKQILRRHAQLDSTAIALVEKKALGKIKKCSSTWCQINFSGLTGWMRHNQIWGVYPRENVR